MEIISEDEYIQRWLESLRQEKVYYNVNGFDSWQKFESQCGNYDSRFVNLRPNLQMSISDELNHQNFSIKCEHFNLQTFTSRFCFSGCSAVSCPNVEGVAANYEEKGGYNYLFYLPDIKEIEHYYSASGYYAIQFFSLPSPIKAFRFEDVPHSCRKCCMQANAYATLPSVGMLNFSEHL